MLGWSGLPDDIRMIVLGYLDATSLARVARIATASDRNLIVQTLLLRAAASGLCVLPHKDKATRYRGCRPPYGCSSWADYLAWLERRRREAWMPVAVGRQACFFAANHGTLMVYGVANRRYNEPSLLGIDTRVDIDITNPVSLQSVARVKFRSISCGYDFCVAVSASGAVYTWGAGRSVPYPGRMTHGRVGLGHGNNESQFVPTLVRVLTNRRVLSVATGYSHSIAVAESGEAFSWGLDDFGQCGYGAIQGAAVAHTQLTPKRIPSLFKQQVRVRNASAGKHHTIVVTETGDVYTFGRGTEGVLGHGDRTHRRAPELVLGLRHTRVSASASGDFHALVLTVGGKVFAWGENVVGELGTGTRSSSDVPQQVRDADGHAQLSDVRSVAATLHASCAVTFTGELFTWGNGPALGHATDELSMWGTGQNFILHPKRVEALRHVGVEAISIRRWENGEAQTLVVTDSGQVYGWGWGTKRVDERTIVFSAADALKVPCLHTNLTCRPHTATTESESRGYEIDLFSNISKLSSVISSQT